MKSERMKRILLSVIAFLFVGCSIAGGTVLLSNSYISDSNRGGDSTSSENELTKNAPTNSDLWTDGHYATAFDNEGEAGIDGSSEEKAYEIRTAEQLALLAYRINTSSTNSTYKTLHYVQTADIDLSLHYWDAIGFSSTYYFAGNYDGGGYEISGMFTMEDENYQGIFGYVRGTSSAYANINNVGVVNSQITGRSYCGAVVGYTYYTNITECFNEAVISSTGSYVGGVIGYGYYSFISECYNVNTISSSSTYVGGVVGYANYTSIHDCYNTGAVTSTYSGSSVYVGGVVGSHSNATGDLYNCYNTGSVTCANGYYVGGVVGSSGGMILSSYNVGAVNGNRYVGGIVGNGCSIMACYNTADIIGKMYVGGISGSLVQPNSISNCYNLGLVQGSSSYVGGVVGNCNTSTSVYNCVNNGEVSGGSGSSMGAIAGVGSNSSNKVVVSNCFWGEDLNISVAVGTSYSSTDCGRCSIENMKNINWYQSSIWNDNYLWDFDAFWIIKVGQNDGFPVLKYFVEENVEYYWINIGEQTDSFEGGSGTQESPYEIKTPQQLARLAYLINNSATNETYARCYYRQTADIDLSGYFWEPIGKNSNSTRFLGHYDGGNYTISNIKFANKNAPYAGLFGYAGYSSSDEVILHNIKISSSDISGDDYVGAIVGRTSYTNIFDCEIDASVSVISLGSYAGGVVGYLSGGEIYNCHNYGDVVSRENYAGGICGTGSPYNSINEGEISGYGNYIGGITGSGSPHDCYNKGTISVETADCSRIGGITGYNSSDVYNCYNEGMVYAIDAQYVGGISGYIYSDAVYRCCNIGEIIIEGESSYIGGICGYGGSYNRGEVYGCYNIGDITAENSSTVGGVGGGLPHGHECYNAGKVVGYRNVGGVAGQAGYDYVQQGNPIYNCYNKGEVIGNENVGGVAGYCLGIYNCFNVGSVTGVTSVGAIAAYNRDFTAPAYSYWAGNCQIDIAIGDGSSSSSCSRCNENDLKSKGWYYEAENWDESYPWQFGLYWTFVDGENDGYPVLKAFYEENYDSEAYWTENEYYADSFASGTGTVNDPYLISTPEQLGRLAYVINEPTLNAQYKNCYYKQTKNLDVSSHWWKPIGTYISEDEYYAFSGNYDGGGYTISGIFTKDGSSSSYSYRGVFGYITSPAEIKNLGVINSMINGYQYVGAIVGWAGSGTIVDNCYNEVDVTSNYRCAGGIAGSSNGTISNCYNIADITGCGNYVGGIAGQCSQVRYCYNTGRITADTYESSTGYETRDDIGGIVGSGRAYYCYNTGSVSGMRCIGGIAGRGGAQNCYNTGSVSGNWESSGTGGIVGYQDYDIYNCINYGSVFSPGSTTSIIASEGGGIVGACFEVLANCVNLGSVSGSGNANIGAIYGDAYLDYSVSSCYRGGNSPTYGYGSSCTIENVKTESWFTSTSRWNSSYPWDFEDVWTFVEGENDGYPVLGVASRTFVTYHNNLEVEEVHSDSKTGLSATFVIKSYDLFERTGYQIVGWTTEPNGGTGYMPGATYTGGNLDLYAQWERISYIVSFDANGGNGTMESLEKDYNKDLVLPLNEFIWAGHDFKGWAVSANGSAVYEDGANYATNASVTLYAVWEARNPAYYDSEGGFWYVENGKLPQSKVSESLKGTLSGQWSSLSDGSVYYMGVEELANGDFTTDGGMQSKVYNGEEYVKFNGEYYLVEPIRWRLVYSSSQQEGYAVENTSVLATMAEIVFLGSYSSTKIGVGAGYSAESVTMLLKNQVSTEFLVKEDRSVDIFGTTTPKDTTSVSGSVFVASSEELANFTTNKNNTTGSGVKAGKVSLSDFVKDYLRATGQGNYYFTRDLGDQLNTIRCLNPVGDRSQAKAQQTLGVQFTIKVTEYACKEM